MDHVSGTGTAELKQFKIFWSSRSPFVRNVMIAIHELGLADRVDVEAVVVNGINVVPQLEDLNPLGQIPTLVTPDGIAIYDSRVIIDYLDAEFGSRRLLPTEFPRRLDVLRRAAIAQGLTEKAMRWLIERFRPESARNETLMIALGRSIDLTLNAVEEETSNWRDIPIDAGHIGLAAILGYLDFRFAAIEWRKDRPRLAAWHAGFAQRPSYVNTEFADSLNIAPAPVKV